MLTYLFGKSRTLENSRKFQGAAFLKMVCINNNINVCPYVVTTTFPCVAIVMCSLNFVAYVMELK